jgi:hypothetical protein
VLNPLEQLAQQLPGGSLRESNQGIASPASGDFLYLYDKKNLGEKIDAIFI